MGLSAALTTKPVEKRKGGWVGERERLGSSLPDSAKRLKTTQTMTGSENRLLPIRLLLHSLASPLRRRALEEYIFQILPDRRVAN